MAAVVNLVALRVSEFRVTLFSVVQSKLEEEQEKKQMIYSAKINLVDSQWNCLQKGIS